MAAGPAGPGPMSELNDRLCPLSYSCLGARVVKADRASRGVCRAPTRGLGAIQVAGLDEHAADDPRKRYQLTRIIWSLDGPWLSQVRRGSGHHPDGTYIEV